MFQQILPEILKHEGYYSNHSNDRGGETYRGIARKFHPSWSGWRIIDEEKRRKGSLPRNYKSKNTEIEPLVEQFYKSKFWDRILLDQVNDSSMQRIIFDAYVNSRGNGIKVLQRVLRDQFGKNIAVDGAQGRMTVAAINSVNPKDLFEAYKTARASFYNAIATGGNKVFLKGWLNRLSSFKYTPALSATLLVGLTVGSFFLSNI
jgi:lysozyme family protein